MSGIAFNLVVLRTPDLARAVEFYSRLGLQFTKHRHGKGPEHFAAELGDGVFELYPQATDGPSTLGTRIGFRVSSVDEIVAALQLHVDLAERVLRAYLRTAKPVVDSDDPNRGHKDHDGENAEADKERSIGEYERDPFHGGGV